MSHLKTKNQTCTNPLSSEVRQHTDCKRAALSTTGRDLTPTPSTQIDREYKIEIPFGWGALVGEQPAKADATLGASTCVRHAAPQMLPTSTTTTAQPLP